MNIHKLFTQEKSQKKLKFSDKELNLTKEEVDRLIFELEDQLKTLDSKRIEVLEKLAYLQQQKKTFIVAEDALGQKPDATISGNSPASQKIGLFRSLFKGREDLFALRWESAKTGKSGYQPVCKNDWIRGICRKPEIRCGECAAREFVPLTDNVILRHLYGLDPTGRAARRARKDFVIGTYPLLQDESCWFLAVDFDKASWKADVSAYSDTCSRFNIPLAVERSRSGNGAHAWIFFSESIPAVLARKLGSYLLSETLDKRPEIGLDSYDRLFPNQDTLPGGGFGNLIALPLQYQAAEQGNSVFIDENFMPYPDQWRFLGFLRKMGKAEVEHIVEEARRRGKIMGIRLPLIERGDGEPWRALPSRRKKDLEISGPLPEKVKIVLGDLIYIEKEDLPSVLRSRLIRLAAFQNPEFYKAQAMRLSTYGKPRAISCAEDFMKHIGLPRGCLEEVVEMFESLKIEVNVIDERYVGIPIECRFQGTLRPDQEDAVREMLEFDTGVLAAATAFGKTVLELAVREAARWGAKLSCVSTINLGASMWIPGPGYHQEVLDDVRAGLKETVASASQGYDVNIQCHVIEGNPAALLSEFSTVVDLLVLGTRGRGGFAGLLLGSTSQTVLHHGQCPMLIVPRRTRDNEDAPWSNVPWSRSQHRPEG